MLASFYIHDTIFGVSVLRHTVVTDNSFLCSVSLICPDHDFHFSFQAFGLDDNLRIVKKVSTEIDLPERREGRRMYVRAVTVYDTSRS